MNSLKSIEWEGKKYPKPTFSSSPTKESSSSSCVHVQGPCEYCWWHYSMGESNVKGPGLKENFPDLSFHYYYFFGPHQETVKTSLQFLTSKTPLKILIKSRDDAFEKFQFFKPLTLLSGEQNEKAHPMLSEFCWTS